MTATDDPTTPFGVYVHVPFCASRCGYCAFNTYTVNELGSARELTGYVDAAIGELRLARRTIGNDRPVRTVFFGGGTPTMLAPADLVRIVDAIRIEFGFAPDVEITVEANPDSIDRVGLATLRAGGFTRVSFGMQSVRTHVLAVLERTHTPGRAQQAVADARAAGFDHINLDLIYGTPGESDADWSATIDAVMATAVDHVSAYALTLGAGHRLRAQVRQGRVGALDEDALATRYSALDARLAAAGFEWYELSNWARGGRPVPAQPDLLAGPRLVGHRPGRPQPRCGTALAQRGASPRLRGPHRAGMFTRGRSGRDPRRAGAAPRTGDDANPARRRLSAGAARPRGTGGRGSRRGRRIARTGAGPRQRGAPAPHCSRTAVGRPRAASDRVTDFAAL